MYPFFTAVLAGLCNLFLASAVHAQSQRLVNIYSWAEYFSPEVLTAFTRETGIKVRYDTFDSNDILEVKLLAGRSGYDVVMPTGYFLTPLIKAGVLEKLDKAKLPNLVHAWPEITGRLATYDPGNAYAVNYVWGTTGIGYNIKALRSIVAPATNVGWATVFDPEIVARFKQCGVDMLDSVDDVIPAALGYLGRDPNSVDAADLARAEDVLVKVRPSVRRFNSSAYGNALASGEVCLAVGWSGDIKQAQEASRRAKRDPQIEYTIPDGRAQLWLDNLAIPKGADNLAEAHAFIDFMQRPEMAAKNTNSTRNANGNIASRRYIDSAILNDASIYPPPDVMKKLYVLDVRDQPTRRLLQRVWTRIKTGR